MYVCMFTVYTYSSSSSKVTQVLQCKNQGIRDITTSGPTWRRSLLRQRTRVTSCGAEGTLHANTPKNCCWIQIWCSNARNRHITQRNETLAKLILADTQVTNNTTPFFWMLGVSCNLRARLKKVRLLKTRIVSLRLSNTVHMAGGRWKLFGVRRILAAPCSGGAQSPSKWSEIGPAGMIYRSAMQQSSRADARQHSSSCKWKHFCWKFQGALSKKDAWCPMQYQAFMESRTWYRPLKGSWSWSLQHCNLYGKHKPCKPCHKPSPRSQCKFRSCQQHQWNWWTSERDANWEDGKRVVSLSLRPQLFQICIQQNEQVQATKPTGVGRDWETVDNDLSGE